MDCDNGRADFTMDCLPRLNAQVAQYMHLDALPDPMVVFTDKTLPGPFGFAMVNHGIVYLNPSRKPVKNFHVVHELVHVYQYGHKLTPTCGSEVQAQKITSQWCETHNCPVHKFNICEKVSK